VHTRECVKVQRLPVYTVLIIWHGASCLSSKQNASLLSAAHAQPRVWDAASPHRTSRPTHGASCLSSKQNASLVSAGHAQPRVWDAASPHRTARPTHGASCLSTKQNASLLFAGPAQLFAWDAASPSPHWTSKLTYNTSFVPSKMSPLLSTGHAQLWVRDETSPKESADGPIGAVPFDPGKTSCYLVFCHSCHSLNLCCLVFGTRVFLFACVALFLALMSFFLLLVLPCFWHSCLSFCYLSYFVFGTCVFLLLLVLPCFWHSCLCFCYLCCLVYGTRVFCFGIRVFVFGTRAFLSITCFALFLALVPFFLLLKLFCYRHSCLCFWCSRLCLTIRATLFIFWVHELHCFSHSCLSF